MKNISTIEAIEKKIDVLLDFCLQTSRMDCRYNDYYYDLKKQIKVIDDHAVDLHEKGRSKWMNEWGIIIWLIY